MKKRKNNHMKRNLKYVRSKSSSIYHPKKRKEKRNLKRFCYELIAFVVFIYVLYTIVIHWQEHLEMKKANENHPTTAICYGKMAIQDLFGETSYIALMEPGLETKTTTQLNEHQMATVSKKQFETLLAGDSIKGYNVNGTFYTQLDLNGEYIGFYIVLLIVSIYPIGYIIYWLLKIKRVNKFLERYPTSDMIAYFILYGGLIVIILFFFYSVAPSLKFAYEKVNGEGYVTTNAVVTDRDWDFKGGKNVQSHYYLALSYQDEKGNEIHVDKEVTRHTFNHATFSLPIQYKKTDPYHVYTQKTSFKDILNIIFTSTMMVYLVSVVLAALLVFAIVLMRKRNKKHLTA